MMKSTRKFLFDTSFDPQPAGAPADPAATQAPPPEPSFTQAELEAARAEGFAAGREQGLKEAQASDQQATTRAIEAVGSSLASLLAEQSNALAAHERNALAAAVTMVRKLFPRLAAGQGIGEIEQVIGQCLARLREEPRIVVRVADPLLDLLRERINDLALHAGFAGKVVLLAEESLAIDAVRVEWADGGAERNSEQIWQSIDGLLAHALGGAGAAGPPARRDPDAGQSRDGEPEPQATCAPNQPAADGKLGLAQSA